MPLREVEQPERRPKCPKCGREMTLERARDHLYWLCIGPYISPEKKGHMPIQFGIVGQDCWFQFTKLVDPVTHEIVPNPYFEKKRNS